MSSLLLRSVFTFFIVSSQYNIQQHDIIGTWYFDRFGGPHGEIDNNPETGKVNLLNKGKVFTFTKDGKCLISKPGATKQESPAVNYQVFYRQKLLVMSTDTLKIMLLTNDILELYPKDESRPALFLKRTKNGKTSMSAP